MRTTKGFTLIELLIVVIVIGILAAVAVPQFTTATERAKSAKALSALNIVAQAEKMYRGERDVYIDCANNSAITTNLGNYIDMTDAMSDSDWSYTVTGSSTTAFLVTAKRLAGSAAVKDKTITFDQVGTKGGTWPY